MHQRTCVACGGVARTVRLWRLRPLGSLTSLRSYSSVRSRSIHGTRTVDLLLSRGFCRNRCSSDNPSGRSPGTHQRNSFCHVGIIATVIQHIIMKWIFSRSNTIMITFSTQKIKESANEPRTVDLPKYFHYIRGRWGFFAHNSSGDHIFEG